MEQIEFVAQLIGSYGFPIVAYCALFWYIVKEQGETRNVLNQLQDLIKSNTEMTYGFLQIIKEVYKGGE